MENKGFKNTPGVTAFAVGMRVQHNGVSNIVRWVDKVGDAHCQTDPDEGMEYLLYLADLPVCTLDLESVWVRRPYKGRVTQRECEVVLVSSEWIGFTGADGQQGICPREHWDESYVALPLPAPAPEPHPLPNLCDPCVPGFTCSDECVAQHGNQAGPPWRPQVDGKVIWDGQVGKTFTVRFVDGDVTLVVDGNGSHYIPMTRSLHPLPPAPPVKVGEIVYVKEKNMPYGTLYGEVTRAGTTDFEFGSTASIFRREYDQVTITHLVPQEVP